jgi:putative tricarboxylic transport membrane protein
MAVELTTKALWTIVGLALIFLARALGVGQLDAPGPGLMSLGIGIVITAVGASGFIFQLMHRSEAAFEPWSRMAIARLCGVIALLVLYVALFERVGFLLLTFALLAILFALFANMRWYWALALAAILAGANYAVFKLLLGTQLPAGLLG